MGVGFAAVLLAASCAGEAGSRSFTGGCFEIAAELRDYGDRRPPGLLAEIAPTRVQVSVRPNRNGDQDLVTWPLQLDSVPRPPLVDSNARRVSGDSMVLAYGNLFSYLEYRVQAREDGLSGILVSNPESGPRSILGTVTGKPIRCDEAG